jgi:hypothetical protein
VLTRGRDLPRGGMARREQQGADVRVGLINALTVMALTVVF